MSELPHYPNESTDEEIVTLYKEGDRNAFKYLIDRYTSPIYNFVARIANTNDAPDIVSETFIKVWKNIRKFDEQKASFKTWVFTIARNTATDFLRKKHSIVFSDMDKSGEEDINSFAENIPDEQILPHVALEKLDDKEFLDSTLQKLPPHYREVLILHYQEELTFDEIGKVLNKPLNTVKSQHRRAIIELRKIIS